MQTGSTIRKTTVESLSSPDQLGQLIQITSPRSWITILTVLILATGIIIWSIVARVPTNVTLQGALQAGETDNASLSAVTYIPLEQGQAIQPGMQALVSPHTVAAQEYGQIIGEVASVRQVQFANPASPIKTTLLEVHITLQASEKSKTGYTWTLGQGPDTQLYSETPCTIVVTVEERRPISQVLPVID